MFLVSMLGFTESSARRDVRYTSAASCRVLHRKFVPAPHFTPLSSPLAKFSDHIAQRHLGAIRHPSPPRRGASSVVASVALNLTTRRERPTFAAPPRLAQPSSVVARIVMAEPVEWSLQARCRATAPPAPQRSRFHCITSLCAHAPIVVRFQILSKKLTCGIAWSCYLLAQQYKVIVLLKIYEFSHLIYLDSNFSAQLIKNLLKSLKFSEWRRWIK